MFEIQGIHLKELSMKRSCFYHVDNMNDVQHVFYGRHGQCAEAVLRIEMNLQSRYSPIESITIQYTIIYIYYHCKTKRKRIPERWIEWHLQNPLNLKQVHLIYEGF
jgi:hypothetical protein